MNKLESVLNRHQEIRKLHPGILNIAQGEKWTKGVNTHVPAIIVYVEKKLDDKVLATNEVIPKEIDGVPTDVVELVPERWVAGKTAISELSPLEQRRLLGAGEIPFVQGKSKIPKSFLSRILPFIKAAALDVDWQTYCSSMQDQKSCGSCVSFGSIGIIEACYRILKKTPNDPIKLSEADPFFCSGGSCSNGHQVAPLLDYCKNKGVCLEKYLPYKGVSQTCHQDILPGWDSFLVKLDSWQLISDLTTIRQEIIKAPLVAVMAVHQSFFNYKSGVYRNLGASDPIVGYHCIGNIGVKDSILAWKARNSWGTGWGESGNFWIAFGESGFDSQAWKVVPKIGGPMKPVTFTVELKDDKSKPVVGGAIAIVVSRPDGAQDTTSGQTDASGKVAILYTPPVAGNYTSQAFFAGDSQYAASKSAVVPFVPSVVATVITLSVV